MAVTVKKAVLWRREVENQPGALARTLRPLAGAGVDLQIVMGYVYPGQRERAAIEVFPVSGRKAANAANAAGLTAAPTSCLLVEGDNRPGLGHAIAQRLAEEAINLSFVVAQVIGRRYSAMFGFETDAEAARAARVIRTAAAPARRRK